MPLWSRVVALLRQKLILGIIFSFSALYCGLSLYSDRKGLTYRTDNDASKSNIFNDDNNFNIMEDDDSNVLSEKLFWSSDNKDNEDLIEKNVFDLNKNNTINKCQNSIQGKTLIVDDRGYVCARHNILQNGCCQIDNDEDKTSLKNDLHSCKTCNHHGCCAIYEYCVSCCLHPAKRLKFKKKTDDKYKENLKIRRGEDILRLKMRYLDRFQICLAACRTSSASVQHENTYKDPHLKYCYITNHIGSSLDSQHLFRRDLVSINKNVNSFIIDTSRTSVNTTATTHPQFER